MFKSSEKRFPGFHAGFIRLFTLTVIITAAAAALTLSIYAAQPQMNATNAPPPITVTAQPEGIISKLPGDIRLYSKSAKHYLFLPSSADLTAIPVKYNGEFKLYDPDTGNLYSKGEIASLNLSEEKSYIYEYNEGTNTYNRYSVIVMKSTSTASLYVELDDGEEALRRINSWQDNVETGSIRVSEVDGKIIYDGELTRMKGHGLTSYEASGNTNTKNSYNINIGKRAELIPGAGASKKWVLLRIRTWGNYDPAGLSYVTAFDTYNAITGSDYYNICARYVDLYINGEYRGAYILTERMDINGSIRVTDLEKYTLYKTGGRKDERSEDDPAIAAGIKSYSYCPDAYHEIEDIDITGGYVLEIMCGHYGEYGFLTKNGMFVNVKSPAYPTKEQVQYCALYIQQFENALFNLTGYNSEGKHYSEYIDTVSFARQSLVYAFYLNWEIYRTSTYMYKDVDGSKHGKLTFGPVWDFETGPFVFEYDKTLLGATFSYTEHQQYTWYQRFWQKGDFMDIMIKENERMKGVLDQMLGKTKAVDIFDYDEYADGVEATQNMNWIRWQQPDSYRVWADRMYNAIGYRYDHWYDNLWNPDKYLVSVDSKLEKKADGKTVLKADIKGKYYDVQWYKVSEDDMTYGQIIPKAMDEEFIVTEDGMYFCAVTGPNNAYWDGARGSIFKSRELIMFSPVIDTTGKTLPRAGGLMQTSAASTANQNDRANPVDNAEVIPVDAAIKDSGAPVEVSGSSYVPWIVVTVIILVLSAGSAFLAAKRSVGREKSAG
ncbi:MAG: hypothetical protein GX827_05890 [Clostridiales bacterium]|nr:hypothetical protein [Clostridiales bacterium]